MKNLFVITFLLFSFQAFGDLIEVPDNAATCVFKINDDSEWVKYSCDGSTGNIYSYNGDVGHGVDVQETSRITKHLKDKGMKLTTVTTYGSIHTLYFTR